MIKIVDLRLDQLKQLLRDRNVSSSGNKNELIQRLIEHTGSDEVEVEVPETNVQEQMEELRNMMQQLMSVMVRNTTQAEQPRAGEPPVNQPEPCNRSSFSVREIAETIPEFNPTSDVSLSVEQFVNRVNIAKEAYQWEEKSLLLAVYSKLKGSAKLWLDGSEEMYSSWQELSIKLIDEFGVSLNEAEVHKKLCGSQREQNEDVIDYCFTISALGKKYKLSDQAIIKYIRDGLKNRDLQAATAAIRFSTLREMRETFSEYMRNMPTKTNNTKTELYGMKSDSYGTKVDSDVAKVKSEKNETVKKSEKCYNCFEEGHFASNCPKPQRRPRCVDCQKVHRRNEPQNCGKPTQNVRSVETSENLFIRKIMINNVELVAFVDTGSQCNIIRKTAASKLSSELIPCAMKIKGICGGLQQLNYFIKGEVKVDNVKFETIFYVADDNIIDSDVLIGQNIFVEKKVRGVVGEGYFRFENMDEETVAETIDVVIDDADNKEKSALVRLVKEYKDIFAKDLSQIGKTSVIELRIELDTNKPIAQAPYRIPEPKRQIVNDMVQDLLKNDIITPSESEYASPIVLVKKKDGSERFCVDYRMLNRHMSKQVHPMPNIEERLQLAIQYKIFSTLDLNSGYYQIPIEPQSRKYTAFVTTDGLYEFKRMPFGLKNAPIAFQRLMAKLKDCTVPGDMIHYMDDILVGAENGVEMLEKLKRILRFR